MFCFRLHIIYYHRMKDKNGQYGALKLLWNNYKMDMIYTQTLLDGATHTIPSIL